MFRKKKAPVNHTINFFEDKYYIIEEPKVESETQTEKLEKQTEVTAFDLKAELTKFRVDLSRLTRKIDSAAPSEPDLSEVNSNISTILEHVQNLERQIKLKESQLTPRVDVTDDQEKYQKKIGREMIEVIDSFDRIIKLMGMDILNTSVGTGILAIRQQLEHKLSLWNFSVVDSSGRYDPNRHMAVATDWDPSIPGDHILVTHLRGYLYKGLIFRNSEVTVNRQPKS